MDNERMNIALLISEFEDSFIRSVCEGASSAAKDMDANLFIFPGRYFEAHYQDRYRSKYDYQYNSLFDYANLSEFDAVFITMGTIAANVDLAYRLEFLKQFHVPVVLIASHMDGYPSVCFDNKSGFYEGIQHLIREHGRQKIGFVSGTATCDDAIERLDAYKEVLADNGLKFDEQRVVYGDFSEYSQEVVHRLLRMNPDLDAVVFANDMMAIGGYKVFKEQGIHVGKDISVLGFDDAPCALILEPTLSTVKADAKELGYQALIHTKEFLSGEKKEILVSSRPIYRESCGCPSQFVTQLEIAYADPSDTEKRAQELEKIYEFVFDKNQDLDGVEFLKHDIEHIYDYVCVELIPKEFQRERLDELYQKMRKLCHNKLEPYTDIPRVFEFLGSVYELLKCEREDEHEKRVMCEVFYALYQETADYIQKLDDARKSDVGSLNYISTTFTRDILSFSIGDDRAYLSIVDKFVKLKFNSAYLCLFKEKIIHKKGETLLIPEEIMLKAYMDGDEVNCPDENEQPVPMKNLPIHCFKGRKNRVTVIVTLIFSAYEQYGFLISEATDEYFHYTTPITYQISSAVKTIELLKENQAMMEQLKESLEQIKESNAILDELSKSDELTQIYNRRGFQTTVQHIITHAANSGKKAIVIYADMNNLKIINDQFGHEEGDYSLRLIAEILKEVIGEKGAVGRFGGDEFAAFLLTKEKNVVSSLRKKIAAVTKEKNRGNGKPYFVSVSVGVCEFVCGEDVKLQDLMDKADVDLYLEKKHKRNNVLKQETEA